MACEICNSGPIRPLFSSRDLHFGVPGDFFFSECGNCRVWRLEPRPAGEELKKYYPEPEYYAPLMPERRGLRRILKSLGLKYYGYRGAPSPLSWLLRYKVPNYPCAGGRDLLDVGCGQGYFLRSVKALGWNVVGIDMSERAVAECKSQGLNVIRGDIAHIPFPDESFDVVHLFHVFEHIADPGDFLGEARRVLRPGGELILTVPNNESLCAKLFRDKWFSLETPRHYYIFNRTNLKSLLARRGFEATSFLTSDFLGSFHSSLEYRMNRKLPNFRPLLYVLSVLLEPLADIFRWGDQITVRCKKT